MNITAAARQRSLLAAMPWVFVAVWSTGFVVARLAMPHAPPITFLCWRYAFSLLAFGIWIRMASVPWPVGRGQWGHLAVSGVLMHAGYLGGVWAAVKAGIPAGTVALIVGLQPLLTALWISGRGQHRVGPWHWLGLALGLVGLTLVVWPKMRAGEVTLVNLGLSVLALAAITAAGCGSSSIFPLWPKPGAAAKLVLVRAVKNGRGPCRLLAGLVLHNPDGSFTPAAEAILRHGKALSWEGAD